jgi:hypothetical protein
MGPQASYRSDLRAQRGNRTPDLLITSAPLTPDVKTTFPQVRDDFSDSLEGTSDTISHGYPMVEYPSLS